MKIFIFTEKKQRKILVNKYKEPFGFPMDQMMFRVHDTGGRWGGLFAYIPLSVVPISFPSLFSFKLEIKKIPCSNSLKISLKHFKCIIYMFLLNIKHSASCNNDFCFYSTLKKTLMDFVSYFIDFCKKRDLLWIGEKSRDLQKIR